MNELGRKREEPITQFGRELDKYIDGLGISNRQFASRCSIHEAVLSMWRRGLRRKSGVSTQYPSYDALVKIVRAGHEQFVFKCLKEGIL